MPQNEQIDFQEPKDYSADNPTVTVNGIEYPLYPDGSLSLISCPQSIEKIFKKWNISK